LDTEIPTAIAIEKGIPGTLLRSKTDTPIPSTFSDNLPYQAILHLGGTAVKEIPPINNILTVSKHGDPYAGSTEDCPVKNLG
jgi:hypothetical protein